MPTVPMAESFGIDAQRYDRARPRYPDALVERIGEPDSPVPDHNAALAEASANLGRFR